MTPSGKGNLTRRCGVSALLCHHTVVSASRGLVLCLLLFLPVHSWKMSFPPMLFIAFHHMFLFCPWHTTLAPFVGPLLKILLCQHLKEMAHMPGGLRGPKSVGWASRLETQGRLAARGQRLNSGRIHLAQGRSVSIFLRPSADWMRPTYTMEGFSPFI